MEFKRLFLKAGCFITLGMTLTACGGGGSGQTAIEQDDYDINQDNALYQVYYQAPVFSENYPEFFEITKYSIQDKQIKFSKSHHFPLENDLLTENKLFPKGTLQTSIVKKVSATEWNYEFIPEIKQEIKFELVELDGKNIFDRILPGYRENMDLDSSSTARLDQQLVKFYQNYKNAVFPKSSYCYRLKETQWNQAYLESDLAFSSSPSFNEQKQQIISRYNQLGEDQKYYRLLDTQWQGYNLIVLENLVADDRQSLLGNQNNQTAYSQFMPSTLWDADQNLAYEKSHPVIVGDDLNNEASIIQQIALKQRLNIAKLEKGCFAFNTQAIQAIQKLNLIQWKQGDYSGVGQFFGQRTFVFEP